MDLIRVSGVPRATSHTSHGHGDHVIVRTFDSHPKAVHIDMVHWNLHQTNLLEVSLM